jgi:hypothetical protein
LAMMDNARPSLIRTYTIYFPSGEYWGPPHCFLFFFLSSTVCSAPVPFVGLLRTAAFCPTNLARYAMVLPSGVSNEAPLRAPAETALSASHPCDGTVSKARIVQKFLDRSGHFVSISSKTKAAFRAATSTVAIFFGPGLRGFSKLGPFRGRQERRGD